MGALESKSILLSASSVSAEKKNPATSAPPSVRWGSAEPLSSRYARYRRTRAAPETTGAHRIKWLTPPSCPAATAASVAPIPTPHSAISLAPERARASSMAALMLAIQAGNCATSSGAPDESPVPA